PLYNQDTTVQLPLLSITNKAIESPVEQKDEPEQEQRVLQRSETFIITKISEKETQEEAEVPSSTLLSNVKTMTTNERTPNSNVQRCSLTRAMPSLTAPAVIRPSRLPSRCSNNRPLANATNTSNNKTLPLNNNNNNNRSLSVKKASKLPIRTTASLTKQVVPVKKAINVQTSVAAKTKKDSTVPSSRAVAPANTTTAKKTIRPPSTSKPSLVQTSSTKCRSRSITAATTNPPGSTVISKRTRTTPPVVKKSTVEPIASTKKFNKPTEEKPLCAIEQMNSTSSESSIEENQRQNKLLAIVQDEGYSTWSSSDVKDEIISANVVKNDTNERRRSTGLVKSWLDTTNERCSRKPVKEVEMDKLEEFTRELSDGSSILCPFVRNRCSNGIIIPLASTTLTSTASPPLPLSSNPLDKDISIDSLEAVAAPPKMSQQKELASKSSLSSSSSSSSSTFSRSETFEKILINHSLPVIIDDLADSTDSTCSDVNPLFNMSEYIEDNFLDHDHSSPDHSSSLQPLSTSKTEIVKPEKRLMFPGLFNRLIFLRRVLSDSDLQQKLCCIADDEVQFHVYHSNIIQEHSIELNLMNTYGSDSELHVWSHDCAEQRRFVNERQQQLLMTAKESTAKLSHIERMIRMNFDDNGADETNAFELNSEEYDQQLAVERQTLLQQIYEYPWLLQDDDIDQVPVCTSPNSEQPLLSPSPDLVVPSHNPDFYQLCALTNSSSFATS
ncbi:unnamed protein product, partial [Adineta ricciae]